MRTSITGAVEDVTLVVVVMVVDVPVVCALFNKDICAVSLSLVALLLVYTISFWAAFASVRINSFNSSKVQQTLAYTITLLTVMRLLAIVIAIGVET